MGALLNPEVSVLLYVKNLEQASQWYCENLGFSLGQKGLNQTVELRLGGQNMLQLVQDEQSIPLTKAVFALETQDIDFAHHSLKDRQVDVLPIEDFEDNKSFRFRDAEGNVLIMTEWLKSYPDHSSRFETLQTEVSYGHQIDGRKVLLNKGITGLVHYIKDLEAGSRWYVENLGFSIGDYDYNDYVELYLDHRYMLKT